MASDWIKVTMGLSDKPEVWEMSEILGIDPDTVVGKLVRLWVWVDQNSVDGNAMRVTQSLLDQVVRQNGFCNALVTVGWMKGKDRALSLPNFDRHNGSTSKARAVTQKRVSKHRDQSNQQFTSPNKETVVKRSRNATNVTAPLLEKRREEVKPSTPSSTHGFKLQSQGVVDNSATPGGDKSPEKPTPPKGWYKSDEGIAKAAEICRIKPLPGESFHDLKRRVFEDLQNELPIKN